MANPCTSSEYIEWAPNETEDPNTYYYANGWLDEVTCDDLVCIWDPWVPNPPAHIRCPPAPRPVPVRPPSAPYVPPVGSPQPPRIRIQIIHAWW